MSENISELFEMTAKLGKIRNCSLFGRNGKFIVLITEIHNVSSKKESELMRRLVDLVPVRAVEGVLMSRYWVGKPLGLIVDLVEATIGLLASLLTLGRVKKRSTVISMVVDEQIRSKETRIKGSNDLEPTLGTIAPRAYALEEAAPSLVEQIGALFQTLDIAIPVAILLLSLLGIGKVAIELCAPLFLGYMTYLLIGLLLQRLFNFNPWIVTLFGGFGTLLLIERNKKMVRAIESIIRGASDVDCLLVGVGAQHYAGIKSRLENLGWTVVQR